MPKVIAHESGTLAVSSKAGTYRVCLITEGTGSTGKYPRELFTAENASAFNGSLSFMNHPLDPTKPHLRPATDIAGRLVSPVVVEEHNGQMGFWSDYKPRKESADFVAEYADALGLSVYCGIEYHDDENGDRVVESFDGSDPYKSVDIVVAAGRGGKFDRANEAYRGIKISATEADTKPDAASAQGKKEGNVDEKILEALIGLTASFDAFVAESKAATTAAAAVEADAKATDEAVSEAVEAYDEKVKAISAIEDLLPSQRDALLADAKAGKDITSALEAAVKTVSEFKTRAEESAAATGRVTEGFTDAKSIVPKGW